MNIIRTRIAPSPTGKMHLGTARTAIYCWAVARHFGGKFLLRIEDTDRERSTDENTQIIIDSMKWLGLEYDEGPVFQMHRLERYRQVVRELMDKGLAYKCYATPEELDQMREEQKARGEKPRYDGRWRPENCAGKPIPEGVTPVIRFRNPDDGTVTWNDAVYGPISISNKELDDLVIMRGDGIPTYNFAVVIDDWDMQVSHVIRGADHINNTPRQINIYKALGAEVPTFAHLPLIHGQDGQKLSKRHGSVSVLEYDAEGFLPEALVNYLARLGWGHGDDEKFSKQQLAEWFDLGHCSRSASRFDREKLKWLNREYMKEADAARIAALTEGRIRARGGDPAKADLTKVAELFKGRCYTLEELADSAMTFVYGPVTVDEAKVRAALQAGEGAGRRALEAFAKAAEGCSWAQADIYAAIRSVVDGMGVKMNVLCAPLRAAVFGQDKCPQIDILLELAGRQAVLERVQKALAL